MISQVNTEELKMTHPNVAVVQKMWECLQNLVGFGDGSEPTVTTKEAKKALENEVLTPDVKYFMPGHHPLSGVHVGIDEVVSFFAQLAQHVGLIQDAQDINVFGEDGAVELHHFYGATPDVKLEGFNCFTYKIIAGKIAEVRVHNNVQHDIDTHFCKRFKLTSTPERLAD